MNKKYDFKRGDKIFINMDAREKIIKMGKKGPGWDELMTETIGKKYDVALVHNPSCVVTVVTNGNMWNFPFSCVTKMDKDCTSKSIVYKVVYTILLDVRPEDYEEVVDKICEIGELKTPADRIQIQAKIVVDATDIDSMSSLREYLKDYTEDGFEIDKVEIEPQK